MGCGSSATTESKAHSKVINMLILGASDSGKSTVTKQFSRIGIGSIEDYKLKGAKSTIYQNILLTFKKLLFYCQKLEIGLAEDSLPLAEAIVKLSNTDEITPEYLQYMKKIWADEGMVQTYTHKSEFSLPHVSDYIIENLDRLLEEDYVPTAEDYLRCRERTLGVIETPFTYKNMSFNIIDVGGQRAERSKWVDYFDSCTVIIFCIALDEYDLAVFEDVDASRLQESQEILKDICKQDALTSKPIVILFNKQDLLEKKVADGKLPDAVFDDYNGGQNYENCLKYLTDKYLSMVENNTTPAYTHVTNALSSESISFVWKAVIDILQKDAIRGTTAF